MYKCRHCGLEYMTDEAIICPRCQAPKGKGENFCPFCGKTTVPGEKICKNCGVEVNEYGLKGEKSKIVAALLAVIIGKFGVHNFYLGYWKRAWIQLSLSLISYIGQSIMGYVIFSEIMFMTHFQVFQNIFIAGLFIVLNAALRIWSFVEGILLLFGKIARDGSGRTLR